MKTFAILVLLSIVAAIGYGIGRYHGKTDGDQELATLRISNQELGSQLASVRLLRDRALADLRKAQEAKPADVGSASAEPKPEPATVPKAVQVTTAPETKKDPETRKEPGRKPSSGQIDKSVSAQRQRRKLIDNFIGEGVLKEPRQTSPDIVRVQVTPRFMAMDFKDKNSIISMLFAYYFDNGESNMVILHDSKSNKRVGIFSAVHGGLEMD